MTRTAGKMTNKFLYDFISKHRYAVLSTVNKNNCAEAALVGFAVTDDLNIIFDTSSTSRKYQNLLSNSSIAFVIGWENEQTIQYEGVAKIPVKDELEKLLETYFKVFPDGKERRKKMKDIIYFCVQPTWIRFSDYNNLQIEEKIFSY
jgi:general stress protein 26